MEILKILYYSIFWQDDGRNKIERENGGLGRGWEKTRKMKGKPRKRVRIKQFNSNTGA